MRNYLVGSAKWREQVRIEHERPPVFCYKNHTSTPAGYSNWHLRAERKHKKGYKQRKCIHCGLWEIWYKPLPPKQD